MKICKSCKTELEDNQKFCHRCGCNAFEESNAVFSNNNDKNPVIAEIGNNADHANSTVTPSVSKSITGNNKKLIIIISAIVAVIIVIIAVVTVIELNSSNEISTTNANTTNDVSDNTYISDESKTEKDETKESESSEENSEENYDSVHWEKIPENSEFYENFMAYSYKMGPGTFIDKINSIGKSLDLSLTFKWTGDLDMNGYTRRIFSLGGYQNSNVEQDMGYYFDVIEDDDSSQIVSITPFVGCDYTGDVNQALATLIVMALYAYDEIPIGNEFSTVMDKILAGKASFRYNDFVIVYASNETIYAKNIFKSTPELIREIETATNVELEDYS